MLSSACVHLRVEAGPGSSHSASGEFAANPAAVRLPECVPETKPECGEVI